MRFTKGRKLIAAFAATVMLCSVAACGTGNQSSATTNDDRTSLTIAKPDGAVGSENNNPFIGDSSAMKLGYAYAIYEPLGMMSLIDPSRDVEPWLAEKIEWAEDYKSIAFTAREGVKWSDGEDFTADDIAYTFQMYVDHPELDLAALGVTGATVDGNVVTVTFKDSMYTKQDKVLHKLVLPKHIWEKVDDPSTFKNEDPVGTGPYALKQFSSESIVLTARKDYWKGEVAAKTLYFISYNDNTALSNALASGDADWAQAFLPNVQKAYVDKDKEHNVFWAPAVLNADMMFVNTTKKPFNNVAFRKAVNTVIDREKHSKIAREGAIPVITSVTGLPSPAGDEFISDEFKGQDYKPDVDAAKKILKEAGYTWDGEQLMDPDGTAVEFDISVPQGWTDYVTGISLISDEIKKLGAKVNVKTPDSDSWTADLNTGNFDAALHWVDTAATPYDYYSDVMDGRWLKPEGEAASYNFGRYDNPEATAALNTYATTTSEDERQKALETIERIFVEDVPAMPVGSRPFFAEYNTRKFTGWPTDDNMYAPADFTLPTAAYVYSSLKAVK